jgi:hypothetical protein
VSAAQAQAQAPAGATVTPIGDAARANRPSPRALELAALAMGELEVVFQRGATPALELLTGWEFRGINTPWWARAAGIKKFMKGFFVDPSRPEPGAIYGYNCPVVQNRLDGPWIAKPDDAAPKRFGFYKVSRVDPTVRDNAYLHAVLLDYGKGRNATLDPSQGLRDYLVQVDAGDLDLYLGKAYYALGPARVATSFFVLERHRVGLRELARP